MTEELTHWTARQRPEPVVLEGRYTRLEPLRADDHLDGLWQASSAPGAEDSFTFLMETPPADRAALRDWIDRTVANPDTLFHAVIDKAHGQAAGRQSLMRMDAANGVIELGNIYWGPGLARQSGATEAFYLVARHVFDDLGYRRFEWKCNALNAPSIKAALRFGFAPEGTFRKHMVVKGLNRDTAWFAMTDEDWRRLEPSYQAWLDPSNFDDEGQQKKRLEEIRTTI